MKNRVLVCLSVVVAVFAMLAMAPHRVAAGGKSSNSSQLQILGKDGSVTGFVPLRHTAVKTEISGFVAKISVTQEFENVLPNSVEAIYVFPLPQDSAVDGMTMRVGDREIRAVIHEREEARKIYEAARNAGHTAALLDQERPNIFTQSVANIPPNSRVEVTLSVIEVLKYEAGTYEFVFPLVVGPRYIPGAPSGKTQPEDKGGASLRDVSLGSRTTTETRGTMPDTDQVQDASRISPPVAGVHTSDATAGHDVSMEVTLAAGVPIAEVDSTSHRILADRTGADAFHVQLADDAVLPNKDFILKYKVAGQGVSDAILTHADKTGGYFAFILQPPERVPDGATVPREIIFVLDTSGSMWGFPLDMAKKTIRRALDNLRPEETFNLITFSGATKILFPEAVAPTKANIAEAKKVLDGAYGSGGTEMMKAIRAALGDNADVEARKLKGSLQPVRVVCFMTDGYVGNDAEIVDEVQKHPEARVFSFGIGTAVNRFLLSKMADEGRGEVEFVTNPNEAKAAADRFYERVHSPVLTNVSLEWDGVPVSELYPARVPDLFSAKPIILTGRYTKPGKGSLTIRGTQAGGQFSRTIYVDFPSEGPSNAVLEKIWARRKVDDYMSQDWMGIQQGQSKHKAEIIQVGLEHSLATQYTSFVAVETRTVVQDGKPVRIEVPVELPEHVSPLAVPGGTNSFGTPAAAPKPASPGSNSYAIVTKSYAPEYGTSYGASTTVEVTADAPTLETTQAQVTTTFSDLLLHPEADVSKAEGVIDAAKRHAKEKKDKQEAARAARLAAWRAKLSPELRQIYDCSMMSSVAQTQNKCSLPARGVISVQVQLSGATAEAEHKLSRAGMTIKNGTGTALVTGELLISKLEQLAQLSEVTAISQVKE